MAHDIQQDHKIIVLLIINLVGSSVSLSCYKCTIRPAQATLNNTKPVDRLCSQFEASEKFKVECPFSTFCMKKSFSLPLLQDKQVTIVTRDCAPQKNSYRTYNGKEWVWHYELVEDTYEEGCINTEYGDQIKSNKELHCYCKGNLCNGQATRDSATHSDIMAVIFMFNAMKYVRSVL